MMQNRKHDLIYMDLYYGRSIKIERAIDVALAVISTGALGALFIAKTGQEVFAYILAGAQIVTAARPFLPFSRRIDEIGRGLYVLTQQYNDMESYWDKVNRDKLDNEEINDIYYEQKNKWDKTLWEILKGDDLPVKNRYIKKAAKETQVYFVSIFGVDIKSSDTTCDKFLKKLFFWKKDKQNQ